MLDYNRYLASNHWQAIKKQMYLKHRGCQHCGKGYTLEVHHNRGYKNIGRENLRELLLLCHDCHFRLHRQKKGIKYIRPSDIIFWIGRLLKLLWESYQID